MGDDSNFRYRREDAPQAPAGRGQQQSAEDALAELARLIGDEDPFADFAQMAREPATPTVPTPRPPAPRPQFSAPPVERRFENWQPGRRGAEAPVDAPEPTVARTRPPAEPAGFREPTSFREPTVRAPYAPPPREPTAFREPTGYRDAPAPREAAPETREPTLTRTELRAPVPPRDTTAFGLRGRVPEQRGVDAIDAAQAERSTVRLGYGSLARKPEPPLAETRAPAPESYDDDYDAQDYDPRQPDPREQQRQAHAPQAYAAPTPQGRQPAPAQDPYDDYDDTYDPAYGDDGYMPPHGEEIYDTEPPRNRARVALIAVAVLIGVGVAATAGIVAFRSGSSGGSSTASSDSAPVIRADTAPSKVAGPTGGSGQTPENQKLIYDRVGGQGQPGQEKVVPREEQPMDVAAAAAASAAAQPASPTEPKRVRTVSVRSDGSIAPASATPPASAQPSAVAPTAYAPTQNPVPTGMPTPKTVQTIATTGAGVPVPAPATTPAAGGAQANAAPPAASATGAYVVQVSSQKSEADAMGSFKVLQSRYPQLLGTYKATVKRADLGDKGIYYRAQVGPFANRDEANNLCNALQAQGGTCIVTRN